MVGLIRRMTKLRGLLGIRLGPGAAILPPQVTRIHMDFAFKMVDGHMGPRKFWRNCLPRLKYHNPTVPMTVNRTQNQEGPALMTIYFTNPSSTNNVNSGRSSTDAQSSNESEADGTPAMPKEDTKIINMKHRHESEILSQFMTITRAIPVKATEDELRQIEELNEQRARSDRDSKVTQALNDKKKREEAILAQARGELNATRES